MAFLFVAFLLALSARWPIGFTVVTLLCGTIPFLSFWAEGRAIRRVAREHPERRSARPPTPPASEVARPHRVRARRRRPARARSRSACSARSSSATSGPTWCSAPRSARSTALLRRARPDAGGGRPAARAVAGAAARAATCTPTAPLRQVRRAVRTGTHLHSAEPLRQRLARGVRRPHVRRPRGRVPVLRGQHRAGRRALVHRGPGGARGDGQRRRTRAAAAGQGRRRALPRRRHRELDPGRPRRAELGADRVFVLQVGPDRPAADARRAGRGRSPGCRFEIARRHRFAREMAELPEGVEAHVLPAGGTAEGRLAAGLPRLRRGRARGSRRRTTPSRAYLDEHL